jgi:hypothetical protein
VRTETTRLSRLWLCLAAGFGLLGGPAAAQEEEEALLPPLWCARTDALLADLGRQNFISKKRDQMQDRKTYEWFATHQEIIVLQHNDDGTSCIAAEGPVTAPSK